MRIIAGAAKGRRLEAPTSGTRPLTGRVKEALFSILGERVPGASVLDLYAGSGSFGLEALSRGAASVVFVERDGEAVEVLERNAAAVGLGGEVRVSDVATFLAGAGPGFDLVLVDPPYAMEDAEVDTVLKLVGERLSEGGTVAVHRRVGGPAPEADNLRLTDRRRYGDTELWLYEKEGGS
jgi:16S rRNA (guanine966-N2)-methyltransferase